MEPSPAPRVLIVESYGANVRSLTSHLTAMPFRLELITAVDADSAVAELGKGAVDLVIIDSVLRGKANGYDLCRAMRAGPSGDNIPIIVLLSGYLSLERSQGISAGADLLLHRPVVKEELARMIQLLLGRRRIGSRKDGKAVSQASPEQRLQAAG